MKAGNTSFVFQSMLLITFSVTGGPFASQMCADLPPSFFLIFPSYLISDKQLTLFLWYTTEYLGQKVDSVHIYDYILNIGTYIHMNSITEKYV